VTKNFVPSLISLSEECVVRHLVPNSIENLPIPNVVKKSLENVGNEGAYRRDILCWAIL